MYDAQILFGGMGDWMRFGRDEIAVAVSRLTCMFRVIVFHVPLGLQRLNECDAEVNGFPRPCLDCHLIYIYVHKYSSDT